MEDAWMVLHGKVTGVLHQLAPANEAYRAVHLRFKCQLRKGYEHLQFVRHAVAGLRVEGGASIPAAFLC